MKLGSLCRTDRFGEPFEIGIACTEDLSTVLEMYSNFSPKPASQGLPPQDPETCHHRVKTLFQIGVNGLAWRGDRIIGHITLIPDTNEKSGELIVFVHQNHRNLGIGTDLSRFTLEKFGRLGFELVWLTVRVSNYIALKFFKKLGFESCDNDFYERLMALKLSLSL